MIKNILHIIKCISPAEMLGFTSRNAPVLWYLSACHTFRSLETGMW